MIKKRCNVKILYLVDGLLTGGAERQIVELLKGLTHFPEITTILCPLSTGGLRENEAISYSDQVLDITTASNAGYALLTHFPFIARQVVNACRTFKPDIVHTFGCFSDVLGAILSKIHGVNYINGSIRAARPVLNYRDRLTRRTFPYATSIVANSHAGLRSFDMDRKGIVIHNGVEMTRFENVSPAKIEGFPVLCMVGNFSDKKDQLGIIGCLPDLLEQFPKLKLVLVGRGKNIEKCKEFATRIGCKDHVIFVDDCDSPEPFVAAAHLCLLFSNTKIHGEGISNAIIEYMALAKPVIASECGGNNEIIQNGVTGYLLEKNDQAKLTRIIRQLLQDTASAQKMGEAGQRRISESFSIDKMIASYKDLYQSLI